jgi:hypothetical protein
MSVADRFQPLTRSVNLIQGELETVARTVQIALERTMRELAHRERERQRASGVAANQAFSDVYPVRYNLFKLYVEGLEDAFRLLLPLTGGTKIALLRTAAEEPWVSFFFNQASCRGYQSLMANLSVELQTRTVFALHEPRTLRKLPDGREVGQYGAVQVVVYNGRIEPERVVSLVNDAGPWVFHNLGEPYAFEDTNKYNRKKKVERFTAQDLFNFLDGFGLRPFDDTFYRVGLGDPLYLLERIDYVAEVRQKITQPVDLEKIRLSCQGEAID